MPKTHHLIFEGAELTGKSYVMSQIYDFLEPKYNRHGYVLDGCHWFNSDVGIFGTRYGKPCVEQYVAILKTLKTKNVLFEKLHISDIVYSRLHRKAEVNYRETERELKKLNAKIILCVMKEDTRAIKKRIQDRLQLYPHYERILQNPLWYVRQQREYIKVVKKSILPYLVVDMTRIPSQNYQIILQWLKEI